MLDPSGAFPPGVSVQIYQGNQVVTETVMRLRGEFQVRLPAGEFRIEIAPTNFAPHVETAQVQPGMKLLSTALQLAPLEQSLEVPEDTSSSSTDPAPTFRLSY